jgi:hypothetical protein
MTDPDDPDTMLLILQRLEALAERLDVGSGAGHVRRSVRELSEAVARRHCVGLAFERVLSSVRQLQGEERTGRLRDAREPLAHAERLLDAMQQQLLPALQRSGYI